MKIIIRFRRKRGRAPTCLNQYKMRSPGTDLAAISKVTAVHCNVRVRLAHPVEKVFAPSCCPRAST